MPLILELDVSEINLILTGLGELKYKESALLIQKILEQVKA